MMLLPTIGMPLFWSQIQQLALDSMKFFLG
jgi:hypothetical protein